MPKKRKRRKSSAEKSQADIYLEALQKTDPIVNLILNGHLLLEREINRGLELLLKDPDQLPRLTFLAKYALLKALTGMNFGKDEDLVPLLNSLRNHIAHKLDQEELQKRIDKLRKAMKIDEVELRYRPSDRTLIRSAFISQTSQLTGAIETFHLFQSPQPEKAEEPSIRRSS